MNSATGQDVRTVPLEDRIAAFAQLGRLFHLFGSATPWPGHACGLFEAEFNAFEQAIPRAHGRNAWFTEENVRHMLRSLSAMLDEDNLTRWLGAYPEARRADAGKETVGVILAGNIPLVGFHDVFCVLMAGLRGRVKVSQDDAGLTAAVLELLRLIAPDLAARITLAEQRLGDVDAVIATGSNNTARYFEHYFGHLPHIIRKNRTSVAVLDGTETDPEMEALGEDLFRYFGLGCRNVSKLYLPESFDLDRVFKGIFSWSHLAQHHKWANNYDYHKAIWMMDRVPLLENGSVLFKQDEGLHSPLGSIYYERYTDRTAVENKLNAQADLIQCVVGHGHVPFGCAQRPGLEDYADGVDTMRFLLERGQGTYS